MLGIVVLVVEAVTAGSECCWSAVYGCTTLESKMEGRSKDYLKWKA